MNQAMSLVPNLLVGVLFIALGAGIIHVTWVAPRSRLRRWLRARWTLFGRPASRFGAAAQAFTAISIGVVALLDAYDGALARQAMWAVGLGAVMTMIARIDDVRDDEL